MNKLSSEKLNSKKVLLEKLAVIYRDSYDEEPNFNRSGLFHEIALNEEQLSFAEHNPELIQELQSELDFLPALKGGIPTVVFQLLQWVRVADRLTARFTWHALRASPALI